MQGPENVFRTGKSCGVSMVEQRNFGQETDRKPAMAGFATAIVSVRFTAGPAHEADPSKAASTR